MLFLYRIGLALFGLLMRLAALWHPKAKLWVAGRKNLLKRMAAEVEPSNQYVWFHFASLGEFEQGRPVMEALKAAKPETKLILTFFSPSGYEIQKNYALAEQVFYLPEDTAANAREFIRIIRPQMAVFTKYEYWHFFFRELSEQQIPLYIVSGIFRKNQVFFKWYGSLYRKMLGFVKHFFVQNQESVDLLAGLGFNNATLSGDTRFDRVAELAEKPKDLSEIKTFCGNSPVFIAGSTWSADEALLAELVEAYPKWKFILVPHEVDEAHIHSILQRFPEGQVIRYSELKSENLKDKNEFSILNTQYSILVIDTIGLLSSLYALGDVAYIGGGFGKGIHNTLEAAAYGIPVIFGPNYQKFQEAKDLISVKAGFSIANGEELSSLMNELKDESIREKAGQAAVSYVQSRIGATQIILNSILSS